MSSAKPSSQMQKRCSALLSQVVHVYLSNQHSHWIAVMKRIRNEAKYKSTHTEALNEHWEYAVDAVANLADYIENCLSEENTGENRVRAHRLCVIDRAEQAAHAAIQAAKQQGRLGFGRSYTISFAYTKSIKFHINAMIACGRNDLQLENAWLEAVQLIEGDSFLQKGVTHLEEHCCFPHYKLITGGVDCDAMESPDSPPEMGKPFQMADRYSKHAWAYGILSQIYKHIHHAGDDAEALEFDEGYGENSLGQNRYETKQEWANTAAATYSRAGDLLNSADIYESDHIRPLYFRAIGFKIRAAEACVAHLNAAEDIPLYYQLTDNAGHLMNVATAVQNWYEAGLEAIQSLTLSVEETEQRTQALRVELQETVRVVLASDLYNNPQNDAHAWCDPFLSELSARTEAVQQSGIALDAEVERITHYLDQARSIDPALSPAHAQMQHCWQKAAAVLNPATREVVDSAPQVGHRRKRKLRVATPVTLWLAVNYAHLADGVLADSAAYYVRASQATTAAGDAEQAKCWQSAAEALLAAADANVQVLVKVGDDSTLKPDDLWSVLASSDELESRAALWVRCGELSADLCPAPCPGTDGTTLTGALVRLTELLVWVRDASSALSEFALNFGPQGKTLKRVTASVEGLFGSISRAASTLRSSGIAHLSPQFGHAFAKLAAMAADLADQCRINWSPDSSFEDLLHIGSCVESGLGTAATAFGAGSEGKLAQGCKMLGHWQGMITAHLAERSAAV